MSTYLDALLSGQSKARSLATNEDAVDVDVAESAPPNPGDVLTAVDSSHATWQPASGGGGTADAIGSSGDPINVSDAAPPVAGQVLTAVDAEHATWRVPGLHYDPSIKFWTGSVGSATILPNSWGFIQEPPAATDPVVVYIVSSLEAPPVDSRFGLYVWREMTVPVTVNVLGESQIQGLDGVLGTSAVLLPGADYEWVFYHEDGFAIWGLVSDTAGVAKHVSLGDAGIVPIAQTGDVEVGSVLTFAGDHAEWVPPSGGGSGLEYASGTSPAIGQWVISASGTDVVLPVPSEAGERVGVYMSLENDGVDVVSDAYIVLNRSTELSHQLRPGGWYEWTSMDFGEDIRWIPHGGQGDEAKPALEYGGTPTSTPALPNQWLLAANGDVANTPNNPQNGDCFGIYINGASASVIPATGQSIVSPDGTLTVGSPSALTLTGSTYYEWLWIASASHWRPKNYLDSPGAGLTRTGKTLNVVANADASIVVNADDIRVGVLATDTQHGTRGGGTLHALATSGSNGFMSAQQAEKVNQLSNTFKEPARVVAVSNVTLSGLQTIDGVSLVALDRILLTAQTTPAQNGLWEVSSSAWGRTSDADGILVPNEVKSGMLVYVNEGTTNADTLWALTTDAPVSLGSTGLTFAQIAGTKGTNNPTDIVSFGTPTPGVSSQWTPRDHRHALVGSYKDAVRAVATSNITLSGVQTVDGVALASLDRCLVAGQTLPANNGVYIVMSGGWVRANDANSNANMSAGTLIPVSEGTANADTLWSLTTNNPIVLGTTALTFQRFGSPAGSAATQIETKMLSADTSTAGNSDLTQLGFNVAAGETVIMEWCLPNVGTTTAPTPIIHLQNNLGGAQAVSRCQVHSQWNVGPALNVLDLTITSLNTLHAIQQVTSGNTPSYIFLTVTLTCPVAVFIRPLFERNGGPAYVKAGAWGRCTRNAVIS